MSTKLRMVVGQINLHVGDIGGNVTQILDCARKAQEELKAHVIVFPELTLSGYPPEDLLLRPGFYEVIQRGLSRIEQTALNIDIIVGHPSVREDKRYNMASVFRKGQCIATYAKQCLPNYSVFDEKRYFSAGTESCVIDIQGTPVALTICEDIWEPGPVRQAAAAGAKIVLNLNASPYHLGKWQQREKTVAQRSLDNRVAIVYVNQVGGQDELVFDGQSFVTNSEGILTQRLAAFESQLATVNFSEKADPLAGAIVPAFETEQSVYQALLTGVHDYVEKNNFPGVVIGLSGGIDSALTLAIAVDALGAERVEAVMMPSRYTRDISLEDARTQSETLGVLYTIIPINTIFSELESALSDRFAGLTKDTTEENLQARIRGMLLMAISNKTGKMVLTTGNKSEMAVGYATLYGDMAGGFAPIKDVTKTMIYRLAAYRNRQSAAIPQRVITRAPSAELAPDQKDTDSLPPYEILDKILLHYIEEDASQNEIVAKGFERETVDRVIRLIDHNEYKRRQAPPGIRVTPRAFGRDRRYPITSLYREDETG